MAPITWLLPAALCALVAASPAVIPEANEVRPRQPLITPSPVLNHPSRTLKDRRNIFSDLKGDVDSILSDLGSDIPSFVASGIPNFFQGFPTGDKVQSSLGLDDDQVKAYPTNVLNIPPYANFTDEGWQIRFRGNVYKQPNTSNETLEKLANDLFIYGTKLSDLPDDQQAQARNLTAEIFVLQQSSVNVSTIHIEPAMDSSNSGGSTNATGGSQDVELPYETTPEGDFDVFVPIDSSGLMQGNDTEQIQRMSTHVEGASLGNGTAYLVPNKGLTVISDIDDILRVTKIYEPKEGLLNSFARAFVPWENMPDIYANWSQSLPNLHFHYLTTTPEQVTRNYMQFIYDTYPAGSFDTRPLNFSDITATLSIRKYLLTKYFETFPERKIVLVADTSNSDVMKDYPELAQDFPDQVQCIFLRNTSASDPGDKFPYNTKGFKGLPQEKYMFFVHPNDLTNLDLSSGNCYNQSVAQNLTYGYQGLPGGLGKTPEVNGSANDNGDDKGAAAGGAHVRLAGLFAAALGAVFWVAL